MLSNYDFHDIHSVLTTLRSQPDRQYNIEIIKAVLEILLTSQSENIIDDNIIRKRLRAVESIDKEIFRWIYVDNIYTYGRKVIKDEICCSFLAKGFKLMLQCATCGEYNRISDLADALHNVPIYFAEEYKNFKRYVKHQFSHYNKIYKTDLLKDLLN